MNYKEMTTLTLKRVREALVGEYIGEWSKPQSYFDQLKEIDTELKNRQ